MDAKKNGALPVYPQGVAPGLTKRELFAAMAMQGMCMMKSPPYQGRDETLDEAFAREAVERADALLAALNPDFTP